MTFSAMRRNVLNMTKRANSLNQVLINVAHKVALVSPEISATSFKAVEIFSPLYLVVGVARAKDKMFKLKFQFHFATVFLGKKWIFG